MNGLAAAPILELRRSLPVWLAAVSFAFGFLSGVRSPNLWSATHLLFDYSAGFVKRGLVGEFLSFFLRDPVAYETTCVIGFAIFFLWVATLFAKLNALSRTDPAYWLVAAVFFVSPGFTFLVHEIGYLDHVGILVVLICFGLPPDRAGLLARVAICMAMTLVHEAFFLMFFPVVVVEYWYSSVIAGNARPERPVLLLVALVAAATYAVGQATLPASQEAGYTGHLAARAANFPLREAAIKVLFRDGAENLAIMTSVWREPASWDNLILAAVFMLPAVGGMGLICGVILCRTVSPGAVRGLLCLAVALGAISPLLLNLFGKDLWRFFALAQVSAFLMLVAVSGRARISLGAVFNMRYLAALLAMLTVLGAATKIPLFDGYEVVRPPFAPHLAHVADAVQGRVPWVAIPPR